MYICASNFLQVFLNLIFYSLLSGNKCRNKRYVSRSSLDFWRKRYIWVGLCRRHIMPSYRVLSLNYITLHVHILKPRRKQRGKQFLLLCERVRLPVSLWPLIWIGTTNNFRLFEIAIVRQPVALYGLYAVKTYVNLFYNKIRYFICLWQFFF